MTVATVRMRVIVRMRMLVGMIVSGMRVVMHLFLFYAKVAMRCPPMLRKGDRRGMPAPWQGHPIVGHFDTKVARSD